jgi:hypothetical protein
MLNMGSQGAKFVAIMECFGKYARSENSPAHCEAEHSVKHLIH